MPIISFSESDKLVAIVADAAWYKAVVKTMEMKASGSEKSTNFWTEFELTDGKYKGKEIKVCFNTNVNQASILGGTQFRPSSDLLLLYAAVKNVPLAEVPLSLDTDAMLLAEFDLQILVDVFEGLPVNKTGGFAPAGKATSAGSLTF